jgi:hypothetical protein
MPCPICDQKPMNCDCTEAERQMYAEIEELRELVPQWMSVNERLPEEGVRCIIAARRPGRYVIDGEPKDGHEIEFGEWHGNRWKCFSGPGMAIYHPSMVSHWMPLPEPPTP